MRKLFLFFLLIPVFSIAQKLEGQKLIDSLLVELPKMKEDTLKVNLLNSLAFEHKFIENKKTLDYANSALLISKKISFKEGEANSYRILGVYYTINSDFKEAISCYEKALRVSKSKKNKLTILRGMGSAYNLEGNYTKAIEFHHKSLKLSEQTNDEKSIAKVLLSIGNVYREIKEYKKSVSCYTRGLEINKKLKIDEDNNIRYCNLGYSYLNLKEFDKSIQNFEKANVLNDKFKSITGVAYTTSGIGQAYLGKKDFEKAIKYSEIAKKMSTMPGNQYNLGICISTIGISYFNLSNLEKNEIKRKYLLTISLNNFEEYLKIVTEINELNGLSLAHDYISRIQKIQGNYKESLESHQQYVIYKDSVFNSDNKETIKNLEDKREIELRDKEIKINKLSLEAKEKQKWYLFGGIGLLAIIGGLLFYQSRKRKQVNQKLEVLNQTLDQANQTKTRFFNILNHDLRGPVANLIDFLQIQKDSPDLLDEATKNRIQDTTLSSAENLLSSMEDILLWSKGQMANFKPQLKQIEVSKLFDDTKKVFSGYLKIKFEYQNPDNLEVFTDENYLKTIIRNLTSNAINVFTTTENPTIIWKAWQENGISYLSITDNGSGASKENFKALYDDTEVVGIKTGLGLHLIRDLAKAINCQIVVDSKVGVGTTFTLKM